MLSWTYIGFTILFALMVICILVGNTLVILVVTLNRSMKTPTNYLLVNLASADMVVAVFIGLQPIATPTVTHPQGTLGSVLCKMLTGGNPGWVGAVVSVFSLVAIVIKRYWTVLNPTARRSNLQRKRLLHLPSSHGSSLSYGPFQETGRLLISKKQRNVHIAFPNQFTPSYTLLGGLCWQVSSLLRSWEACTLK